MRKTISLSHLMGRPADVAQSTAEDADMSSEQVLEYLSKKGYHRTEAMLRKESEPEPPPAGFPPPEKLVGGPRFTRAFGTFKTGDWSGCC